MKRPSHKELTAKLRDAQNALESGKVALVNQTALAADALELDYLIGSELNGVLRELIITTRPEDYKGNRPPQRAYESEIKDLELFAFVVFSERFSRDVYYKFALEDNILWLISLHENRK